MLWNSDPKSTTLEQAYAPLFAKAKFDQYWSIAELKLDQKDLQWLAEWFLYLRTDKSVLYRSGEMFGALLLCLGAELCRDQSNEDSVWPSIRNVLPGSHPFRGELFLSNGQPSQFGRRMIGDAVRSLNLRNALDIEGTQQYYLTIKLQFGFTFRGAKSRLAEWLVGLGPPHAVQYLNDDSDLKDMASDSFRGMWKTLRQFRQGSINEAEARQTLLKSPWVKHHWIADLLIEAQSRIETLGTDFWPGLREGPHVGPTAQEDICPIESISLKWDQGSVPRMVFHVDQAAIENEVSGTNTSELDFFVDGNKMCRWLRQRDGSWDGNTSIDAQPARLHNQPNLHPKVLAVRSGSGDVLFEWDFADSGLSQEVLIFDLDKPRMVNFGTERLDRNRHYAILCDKSCDIQSCTPVETFERDNSPRQAFRLATPIEETISIVYEDFVLWQPVGAKEEDLPPFSITLRTPDSKSFSLNDQTEMIIEGFPDDVADAKLLIHKKTYMLSREGSNWRTTKNITLTPELAAMQRRVRVRFAFAGRRHTVEPRLSLNLLGAAMVRHKRTNEGEVISLEPLKGDILNRSEGTMYLRIWTPERTGHPSVLESEYLIGRLRNSKVRLRDIPGWGGELRVLEGDKVHSLAVHCHDKGCMRQFLPAMLGSPAKMFLLSDKNPNESGYVMYEWALDKQRAVLRSLPREAILRKSNDRTWAIDCSSDLLALALTYKGVWLGAWWNLEKIATYIQRTNELHFKDYSAMKWLHIPVLSLQLEPVFKKAVLKAPMQFINTWLGQSDLPPGISAHEEPFDRSFVLRHYLWNEFPATYYKDAINTVGECNSRFELKQCCRHLDKLADISSPLLWKGMKECHRRCESNYLPLCEDFRMSQVNLPQDAKLGVLRSRLQWLQKRVLDATRLTLERLREICVVRLKTLEMPGVRLTAKDCEDLLNLSASRSGRNYLAAHFAQHYLGPNVN